MFQLQDFPDPARVHLQPLKTPEHIHTVLLDDDGRDDDDSDKHQNTFLIVRHILFELYLHPPHQHPAVFI